MLNLCEVLKTPVAIKIGEGLESDELIKLIDRLNPENEAGKITLIARYGHNKVKKYLPELARAVKTSGRTGCLVM